MKELPTTFSEVHDYVEGDEKKAEALYEELCMNRTAAHDKIKELECEIQNLKESSARNLQAARYLVSLMNWTGFPRFFKEEASIVYWMTDEEPRSMLIHKGNTAQ